MPSRPLVICLHGSGSSAAIFHAQARRIRSTLASQFEFLFIDAPFESPPGPGILPFFEDAGPYFRWFTNEERSREAEWSAILSTLEAALERCGRAPSDVRAVMGFSQGALVASLLLHQAKVQADPRWSALSYSILLCGGGAESAVSKLLNVPSVHLHGLKDPYLINGRLLLKWYNPANATVITHDGGHHMPTATDDVKRLADAIVQVNRQTEDW
ncbi:Esterase FUS5 [Lasiodiplodia hormozganensis]|uniref:Esterase FUS5 n=1 Tax=Lasiodiplodia hormozganensis TaxID=869390 RepID=A0AA39Y3C1_9PEZI|nr:Esterase FUS5 [Lasiodiplodia hormozganensis]